jgi:hypothetical protein
VILPDIPAGPMFLKESSSKTLLSICDKAKNGINVAIKKALSLVFINRYN